MAKLERIAPPSDIKKAHDWFMGWQDATHSYGYLPSIVRLLLEREVVMLKTKKRRKQ